MDSPTWETDILADGDNSNPYCYQTYLLSEENIIFLQPSLFLQDMERALDNKDHNKASQSVSVLIDEVNSDDVVHPIHARPDCPAYSFTVNPILYCDTCWCYRCEKPASICKFWKDHCHATGPEKVKKEKVEQIKKNKVMVKVTKTATVTANGKAAISSSLAASKKEKMEEIVVGTLMTDEEVLEDEKDAMPSSTSGKKMIELKWLKQL
jgi:hypothetical protein